MACKLFTVTCILLHFETFNHSFLFHKPYKSCFTSQSLVWCFLPKLINTPCSEILFLFCSHLKSPNHPKKGNLKCPLRVLLLIFLALSSILKEKWIFWTRVVKWNNTADCLRSVRLENRVIFVTLTFHCPNIGEIQLRYTEKSEHLLTNANYIKW